jgi:hypothetical protein
MDKLTGSQRSRRKTRVLVSIDANFQDHKAGIGAPSVARGEEFVGHYRYIIEKTRNNPEKLVHTLDDDPQISVALRRLGEIRRAVNQYWKAAQRRYIEQAHPDFGDALTDFDERWASAYNECRDRICGRVFAQISREFIRNYRILVARTANNPAVVVQLCETDSELEAATEELWGMLDALDDRQRKFERPVAQGPEEFREVLADVKDRWAPTFPAVYLRLAKTLDLESI